MFITLRKNGSLKYFLGIQTFYVGKNPVLEPLFLLVENGHRSELSLLSQNPIWCGPSHCVRLSVSGRCSHHWSPTDPSILPLQQRNARRTHGRTWGQTAGTQHGFSSSLWCQGVNWCSRAYGICSKPVLKSRFISFKKLLKSKVINLLVNIIYKLNVTLHSTWLDQIPEAFSYYINEDKQMW